MTVEESDTKEGWLVGKCPVDDIFTCLNAYERERYIRLVFKVINYTATVMLVTCSWLKFENVGVRSMIWKTTLSKTNTCKLKYKVTCYKANHKTIESGSLLRHSGHVWYILSHKGNSYHANRLA